MKQIRPSDLLTTAMRRAMFDQERVRSGRVLGPIGNKRLVVFNETCSQPRKVSTSTPNTSSVPGSRVPVLGVQGGSGLVAIESTIRGESAGSESQQSVVPAGLALAEEITGYIGIREISATSMEVHRFDADGVFVDTVGSKSIGSGLFPRAGHWGVIRGDDTFEDGSLIFARRVTSPSELKIQVLDIGTNTLHTHTIATTLPTGPGSRVTPAVRGLDFHNGKIYFVRLIGDAGPSGKNRDIAELYSANIDLTGVTLQGTLAPDFSEITNNRSHKYWAWCRVGETIQVPRQLSFPVTQVAIDSMGLDGSDPTFDLTRTGFLPAFNADLEWRASAHGDDRGYILSFSDDTPPPNNQKIELHRVGLSGQTEKVWADNYIQTRSDTTDFNIVASTGGGSVIATAMIQQFANDSAVERFNVSTFASVPPVAVIQDVDLGGEVIDVFLGV